VAHRGREPPHDVDALRAAFASVFSKIEIARDEDGKLVLYPSVRGERIEWWTDWQDVSGKATGVDLARGRRHAGGRLHERPDRGGGRRTG
jgi:hypothetical protein